MVSEHRDPRGAARGYPRSAGGGAAAIRSQQRFVCVRMRICPQPDVIACMESSREVPPPRTEPLGFPIAILCQMLYLRDHAISVRGVDLGACQPQGEP
ncbi:unnamed protein product [Merluccius merluccius]